MHSPNISRIEKNTLPIWLQAYLILLPFSFRIFHRIIFADFLIGIGIALFIYQTILRQNCLIMPFAQIPMIGFWGAAFLGIKIFDVPKNFFTEFAIIFFLWLGSMAISFSIRSQNDIYKIFTIIGTIFTTILLVLTFGIFVEYIINFQFLRTPRLAFPFPFPNQLGIYLTTTFPFGFYIIRRYPFTVRFIFVALFLNVLGNVGSRICMTCGVCEIVLLEFWLNKDKDKKIPRWHRLTPLVLICLLFLIFQGDNPIWKRSIGIGMETITWIQDNNRQNQLVEIMNSIEDWLIIGIGLGCYTDSTGKEIHNTLLSILVETGIIGCLFFLSFLMQLIKQWLNSKKHNKQILREENFILLVAFCTIFIEGFFHNTIRNRFLWLLFAIIISFSNILHSEKNNAENILIF